MSGQAPGDSDAAADPAAPGWYPDPWKIESLRWRDGGSWTGNVSGPQSSPSSPAEFVGGMNVPSQLGGRLNATVPCVRLTIGGDGLRMHCRFFLSAMFSDFEVRLRDVTEAFRIKGRFMTSGVGLELSDGQLAYFWTLRDMDRILSVLQQRGVPIASEPRRAIGAVSGQLGMLWNRGRSTPPSSVAIVPGYSQPMRRLMPLFIVLGIVLIGVFASEGTPFGWLAAAFGVVAIVQSIVVWQRSRRL